jgi:hypothetical protein
MFEEGSRFPFFVSNVVPCVLEKMLMHTGSDSENSLGNDLFACFALKSGCPEMFNRGRVLVEL